MNYVAFALKYRPKDFDEVIGQVYVVSSLRNAILKNRVHHAYLFSGPRGVGKTSLARILAKALNCSKGPTVNPCSSCHSCLEIAKGQSLDIIEIDGASNRGIDEIRTLRENVKLSTAHSRYKIYIVDEVHMLTQEAFNALLKTLEEPPSHVKFIFATTHPHKVLPTILSRCQKFQFNLVPLEEVVAKLKKISELEKLKIEDNLLYTIARAAGGSIRDAESLLDQLAPIILEKGSLEDVFSFLGIIDEESLNKPLKHLIEKDLQSCLAFVNRLVNDGKDLGIFLNAFIEHLRNLLLAKISIGNFKELSDISPQSKDFIAELSKQVSTRDILKIIDSLIEAKEFSQRLNTVRIPLELALIKYSYPQEQEPSPVSVDRPKNESNAPSPKTKKPVVKSTPNQIDEIHREIESMGLDTESGPIVEDKTEHEQEVVPEPDQKDDILCQALKTKWKQLLSHMQRTRAALATHLSYAQPFSSRGRVVSIAFSPQNSFHKETVEINKNTKPIEEIISNFMNMSVGVKFIIHDLPQQDLEYENIESSEANQDNSDLKQNNQDIKSTASQDDDFLNDLLDTFGGKFHNDNEQF